MKAHLAILFLLHIKATAQKTTPVFKDTTPEKLVIKNSSTLKKSVQPLSVYAEIEKELSKILEANRTKPNTATTWIKVKTEAENLLYGYFRNGILKGTNTAEAYFIKMGTETMTAADIAAGKMILTAGIAVVKPAEFTLLRIEKNNSN